jgi:outer membrane receptor protein involved in Fe transport
VWIGTISTSPGVEPTVSTVVDGVVFARPGQATLDLLDIDRIEILRGPQGTLFGKNASSGVLNVVSRKPGKDTAGFIDASYFEGNERRLRAGVSGTLIPETVRASLTALDTKYDGNVDNVTSGNKVNGFDRQGLRAKVLVTPNSDLDITLVADYLRSNSSPTFVAHKSTSAPFSQAIAPVIASTENRQIRTDIPSDISDFNKGISAQIDWRSQVTHSPPSPQHASGIMNNTRPHRPSAIARISVVSALLFRRPVISARCTIASFHRNYGWPHLKTASSITFSVLIICMAKMRKLINASSRRQQRRSIPVLRRIVLRAIAIPCSAKATT